MKNRDHKQNFITTKHDNLSRQVEPCPFCGKGFTFYKTEYDRTDGYHAVEKYFLHDSENCILEQLWNGGFHLGAGDADIDKNYIGEYATTWNRQLENKGE